jgi:CHAD domain-containing protein
MHPLRGASVAYQLYADESVREGIVRCAREQLDQAIGELSEGISRDPGGAVHSARKAIKKERSLLRLARGAMSPKQRRRENAALRDAARRLSDARDGDVMIDTVEKLSAHFAGQLPATTFQAIRQELEEERDTQRRQLVGSALDADAVQELGAVRLRVDDWRLRRDGWKALDSGLTRSYRRGRKALSRARSDRSLETLHDWRKRVKDLWYHERLLTDVCGPMVHGRAEEAHRLSDLLGDDHDLGVLRQNLNSGSASAPVDLDAVIKLIDHRRDELQTEAINIGRRIYGESPKSFRRRTKLAWQAGIAQAEAKARQRPAELAHATREPHPA